MDTISLWPGEVLEGVGVTTTSTLQFKQSGTESDGTVTVTGLPGEPTETEVLVGPGIMTAEQVTQVGALVGMPAIAPAPPKGVGAWVTEDFATTATEGPAVFVGEPAAEGAREGELEGDLVVGDLVVGDLVVGDLVGDLEGDLEGERVFGRLGAGVGAGTGTEGVGARVVGEGVGRVGARVGEGVGTVGARVVGEGVGTVGAGVGPLVEGAEVEGTEVEGAEVEQFLKQ